MDNHNKNEHHQHAHHHDHDHTLMGELFCHLPYAIFSVAFGLSVLSFLTYASLVSGATNAVLRKGADILFHSFHFMHIVFAATGTLITFFRFSKNLFAGLVVGLVSSMTFCTLSDAIIPYIAGSMLGVHMHFHLCFLSELRNIIPFLVFGLINGLLLGYYHKADKSRYSLFSHFIHIFVSSLASIFYLVAQGFTNWYSSIGPVFVFLVIAVVVPCTLSDVIVPMAFARAGKGNERHSV